MNPIQAYSSSQEPSKEQDSEPLVWSDIMSTEAPRAEDDFAKALSASSTDKEYGRYPEPRYARVELLTATLLGGLVFVLLFLLIVLVSVNPSLLPLSLWGVTALAWLGAVLLVRRRVRRLLPTDILVCPRCNKHYEFTRMHRRWHERGASLIRIRVMRYRCASCRWAGLVLRP